MECLGLIEKIAVYLSDPWKPIFPILNGFQRKKPKKSIDVLSRKSSDRVVKRLSYLLLCCDEPGR
jgi:hypothetical protein